MLFTYLIAPALLLIYSFPWIITFFTHRKYRLLSRATYLLIGLVTTSVVNYAAGYGILLLAENYPPTNSPFLSSMNQVLLGLGIFSIVLSTVGSTLTGRKLRQKFDPVSATFDETILDN